MRRAGSGRERTGSGEEGGGPRYCERGRRRLEGGGRGPRAPWRLGAGEGRPGMWGENREARGGARRRWAAEGGASRGRVRRREEREKAATGRWRMRRLAGKKESERMERRRGQGASGGRRALRGSGLSERSTYPASAGRSLPPAPWQPARPSPEGPHGPRSPASLLDQSQDSGSCLSLWVFPGGRILTPPPPPLPTSPTLVWERMNFFVSEGSRPETEGPLVPRGRKIHDVCGLGSSCHNLPGIKYCQLPTVISQRPSPQPS